MRTKYTKELLEPLFAESLSISEVLRKLNLTATGGSHKHIKNLAIKFGIDTSHFLGQSLLAGIRNPGVIKIKRSCDNILQMNSKASSAQLRRALKEKNIEYKCNQCNIDSWNNKKLTLQIHHIDGNNKNNVVENLVFLCPNCHSQTENWGTKNGSRSSMVE